MKRTIPQQVEYCMEHFDWKNVHARMTMMNWKWIPDCAEGKVAVPTIETMKKTARELLYRAADSKDKTYLTATGGFVARKEGNGTLELSFVLRESRAAVEPENEY